MDVIVAGGGPAGLMTAALPDAAGARAEACERGSEPVRQSRGTAMHPRTLEVPTMPGITGIRSSATPTCSHWEGPPPVSMAPMPAIASWPPDRRADRKAPFSLPGLSATLTGISGTSFGARSLSWLAQTCNTGRPGRRQPGLELAATRTGRPDSHAAHSVTVIPAVN